MFNRLACANCHTVVLAASLRGKVIRCPRCKYLIQVPCSDKGAAESNGASQPQQRQTDLPGIAEPSRHGAKTKLPRPGRTVEDRRDLNEEPDQDFEGRPGRIRDRRERVPRRRSKKSASGSFIWLATSIGFLAILSAVAGAIWFLAAGNAPAAHNSTTVAATPEVDVKSAEGKPPNTSPKQPGTSDSKVKKQESVKEDVAKSLPEEKELPKEKDKDKEKNQQPRLPDTMATEKQAYKTSPNLIAAPVISKIRKFESSLKNGRDQPYYAANPVRGQKRKTAHQLFLVDFAKGKTYRIDMRRGNDAGMNPYLFVEDNKKKVLAEWGTNWGTPSRLVFRPPEDGVYRIIATTHEGGGEGSFVVTVSETVEVYDVGAGLELESWLVSGHDTQYAAPTPLREPKKSWRTRSLSSILSRARPIRSR